MTEQPRLEQLVLGGRDRDVVFLQPPTVYKDSALAHATDAMGVYASGREFGEGVAGELVNGAARAIVVAGHPGQGKTTIALDIALAAQHRARAQGRDVEPVQLDIADDIAIVKAANGGSVVGWMSQQWEAVDKRFQRRLAQALGAYKRNRPIIIETGGTEYTIGEVTVNQGGGSLRWALQRYPEEIITTFVTAAQEGVFQSAGDTRVAVQATPSRNVPGVLRRDHSVSYVGAPTRVIRSVVRGAPHDVISRFKDEMKIAAQSADPHQLAAMMDVVQPPQGVSDSDRMRAHRNAAVYALRMRQLGALGNHNGLSTVIYTYRPRGPLRVRIPH